MNKAAPRKTKKTVTKKTVTAKKAVPSVTKVVSKNPPAARKETETEDQGFDPIVILLIVILIGVAIYTLVRGNTSPTVNTPAPTPVVSPTEMPSSVLRNTTWRWVSTKAVDGKETKVTSRKPFQVRFDDKGTAAFATDCNSGSASYAETSGMNLRFSAIASTKMFCEGSKETEYFEKLSKATKFEIQDTNLSLLLSSDSGTMMFQKVQ